MYICVQLDVTLILLFYLKYLSIRSPDDGQGPAETCRNVLNKITKLKWHQVGHIYTLFYDARNHEPKIYATNIKKQSHYCESDRMSPRPEMACLGNVESGLKPFWHYTPLDPSFKEVKLTRPSYSLRSTRCTSWLTHCASSRKVAGSIPDYVIGIFHWHNPSGRTMTLGLT
jgi:hypothetical protein